MTGPPDGTDRRTGPVGNAGRPVEVEIDIHVAQVARMVDYVTGGASHFAADREAIDSLAAKVPGGMDTVRAMEAAVDAYHERVVSYLVREVGMRQFLVLDVKVPDAHSVHQVAQRIAPESRVVYVVSDPIVLAHAHELRPVTPEGVTTYVTGTVDDPGKLLEDAASTLDLSQPVAVMLLGPLTLVPDDVAEEIVTTLMAGVPAGSFMALTIMSSDLQPDLAVEPARQQRQLEEEQKMQPMLLRSHDQVVQLLDGLELVEPGVVPLVQWSAPGTEQPAGEDLFLPAYAALARNPETW